MFKLIIDTRERAIFPFLDQLKHDHEIAQINVGDYAIIDKSTNNIICAFERKTYEDFAASIKDGRHKNKEKMINLRQHKVNHIIYIIEGKAFPSPNDTFNRMPYWIIESAIFHMMMRDNIQFMYTKDCFDTVKSLGRFMTSLERLEEKCPVELWSGGVLDESTMQLPPTATPETTPAATPEATPVTDAVDKTTPLTAPLTTPLPLLAPPHMEIPAALMQKVVKSDSEIVWEMWSAIRGISCENAHMFSKRISIRDLIFNNLPAGFPYDIRYTTNGHKIKKTLINNIIAVTTPSGDSVHKKMIASIPGISIKTAEYLLINNTFRELLNKPIEFLELTAASPKKQLGAVKAAAIRKYTNLVL